RARVPRGQAALAVSVELLAWISGRVPRARRTRRRVAADARQGAVAAQQGARAVWTHRRRVRIAYPTFFGGEHAPAWRQEGNQASTAVRAHQEEPEGPWSQRGQSRGDRRAHGQQGESTVGRVANRLAHIDPGHVAVTARRAAFWNQPAEGSHPRPALQRGAQPGDRGPFEHEQSPAPAGRRQPQVADTGCGRFNTGCDWRTYSERGPRPRRLPRRLAGGARRTLDGPAWSALARWDAAWSVVQLPERLHG